MSTAWWLTVLGLSVAAALLAGYVIAREVDAYRRAQRYTLDFTRKRVGA